MSNKFGNYIIIDGQRYDVSDNPTSEELGEFQDRNYGTIINEKTLKVFDEDK